jgi:hypothetical protein
MSAMQEEVPRSVLLIEAMEEISGAVALPPGAPAQTPKCH